MAKQKTMPKGKAKSKGKSKKAGRPWVVIGVVSVIVLAGLYLLFGPSGSKKAEFRGFNSPDGLDQAANPRPQRPSRPPQLPKSPVYIPVGESPYYGAKEAKVTIVEFSEFKCPYCKIITAPLKEAVDAYKESTQLVFKNFIIHPKTAQIPAEAALAANSQGKFWEMHDLLFENMRQPIDIEKAIEFAKELELNIDQFKKELETNKYQEMVASDMNLGREVGVRGTPSVYINGKQYRGPRTADGFKQKIKAEIERADALIKKGVALKDLYKELCK